MSDFIKEAEDYSNQTQFTEYDNWSLAEALDISQDIKRAYIEAAEPREKRIAEFENQIADLKDYILKVSKFLHNSSNVRPDNLACKERDKLLIKELKLFEKWGLSK